jgi:hypothetical protein
VNCASTGEKRFFHHEAVDFVAQVNVGVAVPDPAVRRSFSLS